MKFYCVTNIFDLHIFYNETTALLKFFEISKEMHFVSLFFLNERNITTSLAMIHLKCTVAHFANVNSSSIKKLYLWAVEYAISLFLFLIYVYFNEAFVKNFMKGLSFFNTNSQNSFHFKIKYITEY